MTICLAIAAYRKSIRFYSVLVCLLLSLSIVPAMAAVTVPVRAGIHDRFNRVVFDWPVPVKYTMDQGDGLVTIQFDTQATPALGAFKAAAPPYIQGLSATNTDQGLQVTFQIPTGARVQAFWSGKNVAFDVLLMSKDKPTFADKPTEPPKDQATTPASETEQKPSETQTSGPQQSQKLPPTLATEMAKTEAQPASPATDNAQSDDDDQSTDTPPSAAQEQKTETIVHIRPLNKVGAAVFVRAGRLWIILDQNANGILPEIEGALTTQFKHYTQQKTDKGIAFIFDLPAGFHTTDIAVRQDKFNWDIYLQPAERLPDMAPGAATNFDLQTDSNNGFLLLVGQPASVLPFQDDALGDKIWVIPVRSPLMKIGRLQQNAVVTLAPTLVGGLLIPQQENLNIINHDNTILIQGNSTTLPISSEKDRDLADDAQPQQSNLFLLKTPAFPQDVKSFEEQRQYLELAIVHQADKSDKAVPALDLARVYLQQAYGPEAKGALDLAQSYVENLSSTPSFIALQGMAYALAGQVKPALDTLNQPSVKDSDSSHLWQAYAQAQGKEWEKAFLDFQTHQALIKTYNPTIAARLGLAAAESAVETKNYADAQNFLNALPKDTYLDSGQQNARNFLQATLWEQGDDTQQQKADNLLQKLVDGNDRFYRVKADVLQLSTKLAKNEIKNKDAIDTLERLRFAWRGDRQEIMILRELGQRYLADTNSLQAMTIWRQALNLAQNDNDKADLQKLLQGEFNRLFVDGNSKTMAPLQSLSLYQRFKEIMPTGDAGARATTQLADQLLQVDLVDEADDLLQEQLKQQTDPTQIVALGTKLATIRLIARNSEMALKALDDSERDPMPADIKAKRQLLRARALADTQKMDDALALLAEPSIPEGLSLRADIFWRMSRWSDAAHDLQDLIDSTSPKTVQNVNYTGLILRMAIVKAMQNDQPGLDQLNAQYGELMAQAPQARSFQVMTTSLSDGGTLSDLQTLKSQVANTELFEGFLKNF